MTKLEAITKELGNTIPYLDKTNQAVSNSTIGWQIEHSLLVINSVCEALKKSNPNSYKKSFNFKKTLVFTLNKIPRGKAKAPKAVRPADDFTKESLENKLAVALQNINDIKTLEKNHNFQHPLFNVLNLKETVYFLEIHTNHHLKIIKDILK